MVRRCRSEALSIAAAPCVTESETRFFASAILSLEFSDASARSFSAVLMIFAASSVACAIFSLSLRTTSPVPESDCAKPPFSFVHSSKVVSTLRPLMVPAALPASNNNRWKNSPPRPAFRTEIQSISRTVPDAVACDN